MEDRPTTTMVCSVGAVRPDQGEEGGEGRGGEGEGEDEGVESRSHLHVVWVQVKGDTNHTHLLHRAMCPVTNTTLAPA